MTGRGQASTGDFDRVLVVDFGAQYAQLIARRVREAHVLSEIVPRAVTAAEVAAAGPVGLILSGGPASVNAEDAYRMDPAILDLGIPVLGICYGHQEMAIALGGEVAAGDIAEFGGTELRLVDGGGTLLDGLPAAQTVWMSHHDAVTAPPDGFRVIGSTRDSPVAAMEDPQRRMYGVQFHPEVGHSVRGQEILTRFLLDVCGARPSWTHVGIIEQVVAEVRATVGDRPVLCALSGGVDSSVAAALVHKAIGDQLTCVFVDHGLLRAGEAGQVEETFRGHFGINLVTVEAADRFLERLAGVTDPEEKRKAIGETFIRVFEEVAGDLRIRRVPRAGHAVPGRDRVGHRRRRQDQEPPQRRRPARRHAVRADRAAARPLQGRGAGGRRGAGPAAGDRVAPAVPRSRAGGADHRRGHRRAAGDPARRRCHRPRGDQAGRASTATSGRASGCSRRSARWECRATGAATPTR